MTFTDYDWAHVARACTRKKGYPTEAVARLAVSSIVSAYPEASVRPYGCRHCGTWHVGAAPRRNEDGPFFHGERKRGAARPRRRRVTSGEYSRSFRERGNRRHVADDDD